MFNPIWVVAPVGLVVLAYYSYMYYAKGDDEEERQEEEQQEEERQEEVRQEEERQKEVRQEEEQQEEKRQKEQVWKEMTKTEMLSQQRELLGTCLEVAQQVRDPGQYSKFIDLLSAILAFPDNEVTDTARIIFKPILHRMRPDELREFDKMVDKKKTILKRTPTPFGGNVYNDVLEGAR
ncbi:histone H3.v1-like [Adelges cooleyi]|uniref:histone H3.v1-like n=1 Tax=Adelges cooleyi TaxID=133065 RepID=UPI0021806138|nr:histone H3.v1-like [Adelges cooleyi]